MPSDLIKKIEAVPVVALVQADEPDVAVATSQALAAGGLPVIEVVLRTERALDCLQAVAANVPGIMVGAGTVLSARQAEAAIAAGAGFLVSPGLDEGVIDTARQHDVPVLPGIVTATELQRAYNLGLEVVKFFPASIAGGIPALKALSSVFRSMRFMPTGGVTPDNLADYLAIPAVLGCGGSWLTPRDAIQSGNFERITELAREAVSIAARVGG